MNRLSKGFSAFLAAALICAGLTAQINAQGRINEREVNNIVTRLNVQLDDFRNGLDGERTGSTAGQNDKNQVEDYLDDLKDDVENFQSKLDKRSDSPEDVRQVLESARSINDFVNRSRLSSNTRNQWTAARSSLDQLASKYNVSTAWTNGVNSNYPNNNSSNYPNQNSSNYPNSNLPVNSNFNNGLTGTYQLDSSRSDNVQNVAADAMNNVNAQRRDEARRDLEQKLQSPNNLAIDLRGNQVTLASTLASQISFPADGSDRTETLADGSTIRIRATLRGQILTVASIGGNNDYTVTFTPTDNGRSLKVTRRVTTDYLRQTVFAESVYNKTDAVARLDNYNNQNNSPNNNYPPKTNGNYPPSTTTGRSGQFIVPNGTILTGILDNPLISTKASQNNDPFKLKIQSPTQFRGAVVEGYISGVNSAGRVTGRSQLTFNFERIRLANGQVYDFAGYLQSVTNEKGETIKVDTEGAAKAESQSKTTAIRSGIGAGIGAVIGAIAGGGKGAAIGAIIGGGAGAGSVYVQNQGDLELRQGSSVTFQSSSPVR